MIVFTEDEIPTLKGEKMPKFKVTYEVTEYRRVSGKPVTKIIEANNIHEARQQARQDVPLDVHTADTVRMVTKFQVTEAKPDEKDGGPQTSDPLNNEIRPCCIEAFGRETHYHCANCGEESGMYGHYNSQKERFECKPKSGGQKT